MERLSSVHRCMVTLCFMAAGLLAAGAWQDYVNPDNWMQEGRFERSRLGRLTLPMAQAPTALVAANTQIVIDLVERRLTLYQNDGVLKTFPVAIGQDDWQTPTGQFTVQEMQEDPVWRHPITQEAVRPGPANPLGSRWIGFLVEGKYHIGIHGTNEATLIGEAVSHGCVRMFNQDIQTLYNHVKVGTPVLVKP